MEGTHERGKGNSALEVQKSEAEVSIVDSLEVGERQKTHVMWEGKEFPAITAADYLVSESQSIKNEIRDIYEKTIDKNNYFAEKGLVKLTEFAEAYESFVMRYAELDMYYPLIAKRMEDVLPTLRCIAERGEALLKEGKKQ